jgi:hypothetical protein
LKCISVPNSLKILRRAQKKNRLQRDARNVEKALIESFKKSFRRDSLGWYKKFCTEYNGKLVILAVTPEGAIYSESGISEHPYVVEMFYPVCEHPNEVKILAYVKTEDEARKLCHTPWKPFILLGTGMYILIPRPGRWAIKVEDIFELE